MLLPVPVVPLPLLGGGTMLNPSDQHLDITVTLAIPADAPFTDANHVAPRYVDSWDEFIGQEAVKAELRTFIDQALIECSVLPHVLLASTMPGIGKTTLARVVADELGVRCVMIVPPFAPSTLYQAALTMQDGEILFIDEIHKLADNGPRASENLLHLMEEGVLYLDDGMHRLAEFCLMGATTDKGKLPETVVDRFMIKPWFDPYTDAELVRIAKNFCNKLSVVLLPETMVAIAQASRGTPRVVRELVISAKAMQVSRGRYVPPDELFAMKRIEPNGAGREHRAYILAMWRTGSQYVGERTMQSVLRENPQGLARIERVLMEQGLIIKTNRGRALTNAGVEAARRYLQEDR